VSDALPGWVVVLAQPADSNHSGWIRFGVGKVVTVR
jgi:hypothetical protein